MSLSDSKYVIGNDWTHAEVEFLMNSIANGYTYEMVSRELTKDVSNVKHTLLSVIYQKIKKQEGIEAYYCNEYSISPKEIREYEKNLIHYI